MRTHAKWLVLLLGLVAIAWWQFQTRDQQAILQVASSVERVATAVKKNHAEDAPVPIAQPANEADESLAELVGIVKDEQSGEPIANAEITFLHQGTAHDVVTQSDGRFVFVAQEAGRYDLIEMQAQGYVAYSQMWNAPRWNFMARAKTRHSGVVLTMQRQSLEPTELKTQLSKRFNELDVVGVVVDEAGASIAGAFVGGFDKHTHSPTAVTHCDSTGAFRLQGLDARPFDYVAAQAPGFAPSKPIKLEAERTALRIVLGRGGAIKGQVVAQGQPVSMFTVTLGGVQQSFFDATGNFEVTGIAEGNYDVRAFANGWAPSPSLPLRIPTGSVLNVTLRLQAMGRVVGRVVGPAGEPVAGARVYSEASPDSAGMLNADTLTDATGNFALAGLAPGLRSLVVKAAGYHERIASGFLVESNAELGPVQIELNKVEEGQQPQHELVGIGASVAAFPKGLRLVHVFPAGPAHAAGMQNQDTITHIDGEAAAEMSLEDGIERLRGIEGSSVTITFEHKGKPRTVVVTRARVRW